MSPVPINPTRTGGGYPSRGARGAPVASLRGRTGLGVAGAHRSIYRCDRRRVPLHSATMSQIGPLLSPLLVGRDDLLNLADRRLAEAADGSGQLLLLAGQAGVGKSRLLQVMLRKARASRLQGRPGRPRPAGPAGAARLDPRPRAHDADDRRVPGARRRRSSPGVTAGASDTLATRRLLVHDIAERIIDAIDGPALLAFEDIQWADELSLEVIGDLARLIRDRPILLVAAYRIDELPIGLDPPRVAGAPAEPAVRRGGAPRAADLRADGARHDADPRYGPAGAARRGRCRLPADRRDPAPHRGAARRARRGCPQRRSSDPQREGPGDDRGRDPGAGRPPVARGARGGQRRRGHRPLLHARRPRGRHGQARRRPRRRRSKS